MNKSFALSFSLALMLFTASVNASGGLAKSEAACREGNKIACRDAEQGRYVEECSHGNQIACSKAERIRQERRAQRIEQDKQAEQTKLQKQAMYEDLCRKGNRDACKPGQTPASLRQTAHETPQPAQTNDQTQQQIDPTELITKGLGRIFNGK